MSFDFKFNFFATTSSESTDQPNNLQGAPTTPTTILQLGAKQVFPDVSRTKHKASTAVTFSNGVTLQKHDVTLTEINAHHSLKEIVCKVDLKPGVYEGGFKLWECAIDLVNYLIERNPSFEGVRVLEAGCGHGLPGIVALQRGARVDFQDYNEEVLSLITIPNVWENTKGNEQLRERARFFSGDWTAFLRILGDSDVKYDVILSSDTLYSENSEESLYNLIKERLSPTGIAILASKAYYFGVGGGTRSFCEFVEKDRVFVSVVEKCYEDGCSNIRELLKLQFRC